jgi:hypothetical protein
MDMLPVEGVYEVTDHAYPDERTNRLETDKT